MLVIGAVLVVRDADALGTAVTRIGLWPIVVSGVLCTAGTVVVGRVWLALARGLGYDAPTLQSQSAFFVSQLGKYVPGSVWPVLVQMEHGRRWGTPRRTMLAANVMMLALVTATGLVVGVVLLPWSSADGLSRYWWTVLLLVPLLACLHPRFVPAVLDRALAVVGREPLGARVPARATVSAGAWCVVLWVLMGAHLLVLTTSLGASGWTAAAAAVGGMGLGWAAGLVFIPAPAGAGVREVILVATFAPEIGASPALTVALTSRVLLLLADVLLAGAGAAAGHLLRERGSRTAGSRT